MSNLIQPIRNDLGQQCRWFIVALVAAMAGLWTPAPTAMADCGGREIFSSHLSSQDRMLDALNPSIERTIEQAVHSLQAHQEMNSPCKGPRCQAKRQGSQPWSRDSAVVVQGVKVFTVPMGLSEVIKPSLSSDVVIAPVVAWNDADLSGIFRPPVVL